MDASPQLRGAIITCSLLFLAYAGKYFATSPIFVVRELVREEAKISVEWWDGSIAASYIVITAVKLCIGPITERAGGRAVLAACLALLVGLVFVMGFVSSAAGFSAAWIVTAGVQAPIWVSLVKICSCWSPPGTSGRLMGFLSLSYLVDDALVRATVGALLGGGMAWQDSLRTCSVIVLCLALPTICCVRDGPSAKPPCCARLACRRSRGLGGRLGQYGSATSRTRRRRCGEGGGGGGGGGGEIGSIAPNAVELAGDHVAGVPRISMDDSTGMDAVGDDDDKDEEGHEGGRTRHGEAGREDTLPLVNNDAAAKQAAAAARPSLPSLDPAAPMVGKPASICGLLKDGPFMMVVLFYAISYMSREFVTNYSVKFLTTRFCQGQVRRDMSAFRGTNASFYELWHSERLEACVHGPESSSSATSAAALGSTVFSVAGALSVIFCGVMKDKLSARRVRLLCALLASLGLACTAVLGAASATLTYEASVAVLAAYGFALIGPYSLCSGAFIIDFGGAAGSATASAVMDGTGALFAGLIMVAKGSIMGTGSAAVASGFVALSALSTVAVVLMVCLAKRSKTMK